MPRLLYKRIVIDCRTAAEAAEVAKNLAEGQPASLLAQLLSASDPPNNPWTRQVFWRFIESLGEAQKKILSLLLAKREMTNEQLRKALGVESNQQLAGLLSGISKQAAAHNISARAVYVIKSELRGGETAKTYAIAMEFLRIAIDQNWPGE